MGRPCLQCVRNSMKLFYLVADPSLQAGFRSGTAEGLLQME